MLQKKFFSLFKRTQMCFVWNQFPLLEKKILAILRWHWSHFLDCPSGYVQNAGHIPGTGQINPTTSYSSTIGDCSKRCNDTNCCSFEYSDTNYLCYLNILCQPTQTAYIDFSFCTKASSMFKWLKEQQAKPDLCQTRQSEDLANKLGLSIGTISPL